MIMKAKHTRRKWFVRHHIGVMANSIKINRLNPVFYQHICDREQPSGQIIAKCSSKNKEELIANAKLIAAAPELLATLEDIFWASEQRKMRGGKFLQRELNVLKSIEEAIRKATS